jgi:hypothetical protein
VENDLINAIIQIALYLNFGVGTKKELLYSLLAIPPLFFFAMVVVPRLVLGEMIYEPVEDLTFFGEMTVQRDGKYRSKGVIDTKKGAVSIELSKVEYAGITHKSGCIYYTKNKAYREYSPNEPRIYYTLTRIEKTNNYYECPGY